MTIKCSKCGHKNAEDAKICVKCKAILEDAKKENKKENKKAYKTNVEDIKEEKVKKETKEDVKNSKENVISKKDRELKEKLKEQMHGDGGEQFNKFVNENKNKRSSKLKSGVVSVICIVVLCVAGKIIYDNVINKKYVIRNVNLGMTKEEVLESEKEGTKKSVSDDVVIFEGAKFAKEKCDVFYNFNEEKKLYFVAIKFEYKEETVKKVLNKLETSYGEVSKSSKDKMKKVWKIDEKTNVYLSINEENKVIEIDVCRPDEELDKEINKN